jgi:hypothetical protein
MYALAGFSPTGTTTKGKKKKKNLRGSKHH